MKGCLVFYRDFAEPSTGSWRPDGLLTRRVPDDDRIIHPFALCQAADVTVPTHDCCSRSTNNKTIQTHSQIIIFHFDECYSRRCESGRSCASVSWNWAAKQTESDRNDERKSSTWTLFVLRCEVSLRKSASVYMRQRQRAPCPTSHFRRQLETLVSIHIHRDLLQTHSCRYHGPSLSKFSA